MEKNNQALKYNKITYEMRAKLIEMVCSESIPCIQAGKRLGISPSTAKMIVKKFRENGRIFEKKAERIKRHIWRSSEPYLSSRQTVKAQFQRLLCLSIFISHSPQSMVQSLSASVLQEEYDFSIIFGFIFFNNSAQFFNTMN